MDIRELKYLTTRFRRGIEIAHKKRQFKKPPFADFPNACCGDAPELLAQYLMDNGSDKSIRFRTVYGTYRYDDFENIYGHSWLVVDDTYIVDIAADQRQFKNERIFPQDAVQPCYVGISSKFHSIFEIEPVQCREFYGLRSMGDYSYQRLKELYDVILRYIDENGP